MLDDRRRLLGEVGYGAPRGVGVEIVGVRHGDAVQPFGARHAAARERRRVERRALMRVLAVSQLRFALESESQRLAGRAAGFARQIPRRRRVVKRRMLKRLPRQLAPLVHREAAAAVREALRRPAVIGRRRQDDHVREILSRRPNQRHAADVYVLERVLQRRPRRRRRLGEWVQVADDQVDGRDAMRVQLGAMRRQLAPSEYAAVNGGMQSLDPPAENLRRACQVGDLRDVKPGVRDFSRRAARADQLIPRARQRARETRQAGLVVNAKQCLHA